MYGYRCPLWYTGLISFFKNKQKMITKKNTFVFLVLLVLSCFLLAYLDLVYYQIEKTFW